MSQPASSPEPVDDGFPGNEELDAFLAEIYAARNRDLFVSVVTLGEARYGAADELFA